MSQFNKYDATKDTSVGKVYGQNGAQTSTPVITQTRVDPPTETRTIGGNSTDPGLAAAQEQHCAAAGTTEAGLAADGTKGSRDQCGNNTFYDGGALSSNFTAQANGTRLDGYTPPMECDPTMHADPQSICNIEAPIM